MKKILNRMNMHARPGVATAVQAHAAILGTILVILPATLADEVTATGRIQSVIDEVEQSCKERTVYMIGRAKAEHLAELVRNHQPDVVVECGTAIGYSGLWIARELKARGSGKLITIEIDPERTREAKTSFEKAGLSEYAEFVTGDAVKAVTNIQDRVDLLFLDCGYSNYLPCFMGIRDRLRDGAVLIADNVGIGGGGMKSYLDLVRSRYKSHTEWFDLDLPWARRDAMEITVFKKSTP